MVGWIIGWRNVLRWGVEAMCGVYVGDVDDSGIRGGGSWCMGCICWYLGRGEWVSRLVTQEQDHEPTRTYRISQHQSYTRRTPPSRPAPQGINSSPRLPTNLPPFSITHIHSFSTHHPDSRFDSSSSSSSGHPDSDSDSSASASSHAHSRSARQ